MRYAIADIELAKGLEPVSLRSGDAGIGILVRLDRRPVYFQLHEIAGPATLSVTDVGRALGATASLEILRERIRRELAPPPETTSFSLTVAVCTRDRPTDLEACLERVLALPAHQAVTSLDVLVVDNAPSAPAPGVVETFPGVRYVLEEIPGLDFARNRALRDSSAEFVAFLDDDVRVDSSWLNGLAEAIAEQPDAAIVTGLVLPLELETEAQVLFERHGGFRRGFRKVRFAGTDMPGVPLYPVASGNFGAGCNMVVRREIALRLGGFDEALDTGAPLPGGGDLDLFYRVAAAGFPLVYEPQMVVFHRHRQGTDALRRQLWTWGTGLMAFVAKSYRTSPEHRLLFRRLVRWWFRDALRRLGRSLRGRGTLPPSMVASELVGGIVGLAGGYGRSRRRTARLRRRP